MCGVFSSRMYVADSHRDSVFTYFGKRGVTHVKSRKATLRSIEVGVTIYVRDCETRLGVSEIRNVKA